MPFRVDFVFPLIEIRLSVGFDRLRVFHYIDSGAASEARRAQINHYLPIWVMRFVL
jgi:hypothetical protein